MSEEKIVPINPEAPAMKTPEQVEAENRAEQIRNITKFLEETGAVTLMLVATGRDGSAASVAMLQNPNQIALLVGAMEDGKSMLLQALQNKRMQESMQLAAKERAQEMAAAMEEKNGQHNRPS